MSTGNTKTPAAIYDCSRCGGSGKVGRHMNVLNGVCFKCNGSGKQVSKPAAKSILWSVSGVSPVTGERVGAYNQPAKTAEEAIRKCVERYEGIYAESSFRKRVLLTLENAEATPSADNA